MNLTLNDEQLRAVLAKALLDSVTPENRDQMITAAIAHLMTPQKNPYRNEAMSPVQEAFNRAVTDYARIYATEHLKESPSFRAQIEGLFADVSKRLFEEKNREKLVNEMANLIERALTKDRY